MRQSLMLRRAASVFKPTDTFVNRHIGPRDSEIAEMLKVVGFESLDDLTKAVVPDAIRFAENKVFEGITEDGVGEGEALAELRAVALQNDSHIKSLLGQGFYGTVTPGVVLRNVLENPAWYTAYTPYQAEISQGRMEMLLNYQTMVCDLTGMSMSNASLLDEGTAAAEALSMSLALHPSSDPPLAYFVDADIHPSTRAVVSSRASVLGIAVHVGDPGSFDFAKTKVAGALLQYPGTWGHVRSDMKQLVEKIHSAGAFAVVATDLLALTLLTSPGALGADIAVGSAQRFGVPLGYGGPHAGFLATRDISMARRMPGRIMSVSRDRERGEPALRMALQTREQHIRRDKATSNICTAQALLANMAASYAIYHGPKGLRAIAERVHALAHAFASLVAHSGATIRSETYFDTVCFSFPEVRASEIVRRALSAGFNIRAVTRKWVSVAFDESSTLEQVLALVAAFTRKSGKLPSPNNAPLADGGPAAHLRRTQPFLTHPVFNSHHSETDMLRYLYSLQMKDLSLASAMIPLGSCTMKLNATSEMIPVSWPSFANMHPFAPKAQTKGYALLAKQLETALASITGFDAVSLQPNSGAAGEYAGLRAIRAYQESQGQSNRNVVLIPTSAHGTNPASAVMAGLRVVPVRCSADGYIDQAHLKQLLDEHAGNVSCAMITYPSTYGVFEENVRETIDAVHAAGGQVYMDGANMNAQVGLTSPGFLGADVCHLNLHKTFCIPHGGGGPGVGPIGVRSHLEPFLPRASLDKVARGQVGAMASGPIGSAGILPIPWMYVKMMGSSGLRKATQAAILNANYMKRLLEPHYRISYVSRQSGLCAHEFILDIAPFVPHGIHAEDVAKRLIDFGFHAPTMSWPVPETLMVEPTESEPKAELDRFVQALIHIRHEIQDVVDGKIAAKESPLVRAPHTLKDIVSSEWNRPYTREQAAYPLPWVRQHKFWPTVNRLDNVWGDRNLFCSCDGFEAVSNKKN